MGVLDFFRRGKKKEDKDIAWKYVLKRRDPKSGGMKKAMELAEATTAEDLYPHLEPGIYSLHRYRKGLVGFEVVWGPIQVEGVVSGETATLKRTASPLGALGQMLKDIKAFREEGKEAYETLGMLFGGKGVTTDDVIDKWAELAEKKKKLDNMFPSASTKSEEIPISGTIPALAVYAPTMVDRAMDAVEKRMIRWGLISKSEGGVPGLETENLIKLPDKPKAPAEEERVEEKIVEIPEVPATPAEEALVLPPGTGETPTGSTEGTGGKEKVETEGIESESKGDK